MVEFVLILIVVAVVAAMAYIFMQDSNDRKPEAQQELRIRLEEAKVEQLVYENAAREEALRRFVEKHRR